TDERGSVHVDFEGRPLGLTWLEADLGVADELFRGSGDLRDAVREVELDHFGSCAVPGIRDGGRDLEVAVDRNFGAAQLEVGELVVAVAHPEAERVKRSGVEAGDALGVPGQGGREVGPRLATVTGGDADGEFAFRVEAPGEDACERGASLFAGHEGLDDGR